MKAVFFFVLIGATFFSCSESRQTTQDHDASGPSGSNAQKVDTNEYLIHGSSFGMCSGYCFHEKKILLNKVIETDKAWRDAKNNPPKIRESVVDSNFLQGLLEAVDLEAFYALPERVGCPDCADGGSAWVEISHNGRIYRVTYEYGKPPEPLKKVEEMLKGD